MGRRDLNLDEYNITKLQYRELHNFCLQYADKKQQLAELKNPYGSSQGYNTPTGCTIGDPTARTAERIIILSKEIEAIEQTAMEIAPEEYQNILLAVTEDVPWHFLQLLKGLEMGRRDFECARRRFYYNLAQRKGMI